MNRRSLLKGLSVAAVTATIPVVGLIRENIPHTIYYQGKLSNLYISPEAMEDIRIDEVARREIYSGM